ncbi:15988_t:CDS:2 [Entrophospora sp. SA101]|nr:15988_t:CDS:2 [Entrophospora sp. SA101]
MEAPCNNVDLVMRQKGLSQSPRNTPDTRERISSTMLIIERVNDSNTPETNNSNASRNIIPTPSNPRPNQRLIINAGIGETNVVNNPKEEGFLANKSLYYVSREYAQYCLDNDDYDHLPHEVAQEILDQN